MDLDRLSQGERIAGIAGVVLLISLWFSWFSIDSVAGVEVPGGLGVDTSASAWQAFSLIDIIIFLTAAAAIAAAIITANQMSVSLPVAMSAVVTGLGAFSVLLILFRLLSPPDLEAPAGLDVDIGRSWGIFVGLIAAAAVTYGGYLGMQEEGAVRGEPYQPPLR